MKYLHVAFDGSAMPTNPGPMGAGAAVYDPHEGVLYDLVSVRLGRGTNNAAEYHGLILGLEKLVSRHTDVTDVQVWGDSQLVIRQLKGVYQTKNPALRALRNKVYALEETLAAKGVNLSYNWWGRDVLWAPVADLLSKHAETPVATAAWCSVWRERFPDKECSVQLA